MLLLFVAAPEAVAACRLAGARVLAQNDLARLLVRENRHGNPSLYGCTRTRARVYRLAHHVDGVRPGTGKGPVLAGRWAVYPKVNRQSNLSLIRVDLRSGRRRLVDRFYAKHTLHTSQAWVLKPNGSLAWITATDVVDWRTLLRSVNVLERGRRARSVDSTTYDAFAEPDPIPDDSLALSANGRTLHWTRDGQHRAAPID